MVTTRGFVTTSQGQLHYRATAKQVGVPVVLLHQTASASVMFEALMHELVDAYYLLAPDTPGFGASFSPHERPSIALYGQIIYEGLQALGIAHCYLFGHHTGAAIAVQLAYDYPDWAHKLALLGPPLLTPTQIATLKRTLQSVDLRRNGPHLQQTWQNISKKDPTAPLALIQREMLLTLQAGDNAHAAYHAVFEQEFARQLTSITCPTLVMAGERDSLRASLEPSAALLQHGAMHLFPDAGTFICDQQPQQVAEQLRLFFK